MSTNVFKLYRGIPGQRGPTGPSSGTGGPGPTGPIGPTGAGSQIQAGSETFTNFNGAVTRSVNFNSSFSTPPTVISSIQGSGSDIRFTVSDITENDFNINVSNSLSQVPAEYITQCRSDQINLTKQTVINDHPAVIHSVIDDGCIGAAKLDYVRFNETEPDLFTLNEKVTIFEDTDNKIDITNEIIPGEREGSFGLDTTGALVDGNPAVVFKNSQSVIFARNTQVDGTGDWVNIRIDDTSFYTNLSNIKILSNGTPCFAKVETEPFVVKLFTNTKPDGFGVWSEQIIFSSSTVFSSTSVWITLEFVNGNPAVAITISPPLDNDELIYIRANDNNGVSWPDSLNVLVNTSGQIVEHQLRLVNGNPAIVFYEQGVIRFIRSIDINGTNWNPSVQIDTVNSNQRYPSLTTRSSDGFPIVSYTAGFGGTEGVFLSIADDINGTTWASITGSIETIILIDSQSSNWTNLEIIDGKPAVVATIGPNLNIRTSYFHCSNNLGTGTWTEREIITQTSSTFTYGSLIEVNNLPVTFFSCSARSSPVYATNPLADGSDTWSVISIDSADLIPALSSSLHFINGKPAIASINNFGQLIYIEGEDIHSFSNINEVVVDTVASIGESPPLEYVFSLKSIQNFPGIVYYNNTSPIALNFATNTNGSWIINPIEVGISFCSYISLDVINGYPAVAYVNTGDNSFNFAYNNQRNGLGTWTISTIPGTNIGEFVSLAEIDNKPAISCYDDDNNRLLFIINDASDGSGTWTTTEVDTNGGLWTSLNIINNKPAISYVSNSSPFELNFAINDTFDGSGTWTVSTIELGEDYQYTSLNTLNGKPNIAYYETSNLILKNAINTSSDGSGEWKLFTIDMEGDAGQYTTSVEIDNNLAISYKSTPFLKYYSIINITAADIISIDSSPPAPAVFYSTGSKLELKIGSDSDGTSFGEPITIDNVSVSNLSAAVINGNPALAIYSNGELKYIRSDSIDGSSWTSSPAIESIDGSLSPPEQVGDFNSLIEIGSNPAISYYDETNQQLKYIRSVDSNGDNWGTSYVVDNNGNVGQHTSLSVVDGLPAIAYYDVDNGSLKYARASAIDGSGVWTIQTIADNITSPPADVGTFISLIIFNNTPVITYYDNSNDNLLFVSSTDNTGSTWLDPSILDTNGGQFADGGLTTNSLGVSYANNQTNQIKYLSFSLDTFNINWMAT